MTPLVVPGLVAPGQRMTRLVAATRNAGKLSEIVAGLTGLDPPLEILSLSDFPDAPEVEETGSTYHENARLKAVAALRATGLPSLADDTGLEVDALNGAPGLYSARFAGPECDPQANIRRLLADLDGRDPAERTACFRCVLALALPGPVPGSLEVEYCEGLVKGTILGGPRGTSGFGYDPVFLVEGTGRTMAELTGEEKNAISHRGRALQALQARLYQLRR